MKLALLGYPIKHSLSPKLYQEILGGELESYQLLEIPCPNDVPSLETLSKQFDGINITAPYKNHFNDQVEYYSPIVKEIGAINTIALNGDAFLATNTDVIAVSDILQSYSLKYGNIYLVILGSGVMAKVTKLVSEKLGIPFILLSRKSHPDLACLDLRSFEKNDAQNIIINACSREFTFQGLLSHSDIFWDYNYSFLAHSLSIPSKVKAYHDGQEMLRLQANAAVKFWQETNPKLKY